MASERKTRRVISFEVPFTGTENNIVYIPDLLKGLLEDPIGQVAHALPTQPPEDENAFEDYLVKETEVYLNNLKNKTTRPSAQFYAIARPGAREGVFGAGTFKPPEEMVEFFKATSTTSPEKPVKKKQAGPGRPRKNPQEPRKTKERKKDAVDSETAPVPKQPRKRKNAAATDSKEPRPRKRTTKVKVEPEIAMPVKQSDQIQKVDQIQKMDQIQKVDQKLPQDAELEDQALPEKHKRRKEKHASTPNDTSKDRKDLPPPSDGLNSSPSSNLSPHRAQQQKKFQEYFSGSSLSSPSEGTSPTNNISPAESPSPSRPSSPTKRLTIATIINSVDVAPKTSLSSSNIPEDQTTPLTIPSDSDSSSINQSRINTA